MTDQFAVRLVDSDADLAAIAPVLLQLRPQYTRESLVARIRMQQRDAGYHAACAFMDGRPACIAGFVINEKLAWGRHLYVDDLVTDKNTRSRGAGKAMIDWLKSFSRAAGCTQLHLDSGMHRTDAHRFYDREGFGRNSIHFAITDLGD